MVKKIKELTTNKIEIPKKDFFAAIIGKNPSHGARSPKLWNRAFNYFGINAEMIPIDVEENNLKSLLSSLNKNQNFIGGAIAAPYKEKSAEFFFDNISSESKLIGAVNCLYRIDGVLAATNTDGEGSVISFNKSFSLKSDSKILILGIGGTGKAVAAYFLNLVKNKNNIYLSSRSNSALTYSRKIKCSFIEWIEIDNYISQFDLIINATSLGSDNFIDQNPLSLNQISKIKQDAILFDVNYSPARTKFLEEANNRELRIMNGLGMNFEQAVLAFRYAVAPIKFLNFESIYNAMSET